MDSRDIVLTGADGSALDTNDTEIIDVEEYARADRPKPSNARRYRIRIDRTAYVVGVPAMTGRQLLELAGKIPPERFKIYEKLRGGQTKPIGLDEVTEFTAPGVERYVTIPTDPQEGGGEGGRRDFRLPLEDEQFLEQFGRLWETVLDGNARWLVISDFPIPPGYNVDRATIALRIEPLYPQTQIDMAYVSPPLVRRDGGSINGLSPLTIDGESFQQWSRHRTQANPWVPGVDCLETHLLMVANWFEREVSQRVA